LVKDQIGFKPGWLEGKGLGRENLFLTFFKTWEDFLLERGKNSLVGEGFSKEGLWEVGCAKNSGIPHFLG